MINEPVFLVVDLFCGAGGTTTGFAQAEIEGKGVAKVIACVNHDPKAIQSHWRNHPEVIHFEEDIRTLDLAELTKIVKSNRDKYPDAYLILWASLECTNFSKAKGGQPRDADSRTLADHLPRYVAAIQPDYIQIENVVEFMSWGPLDDKGKPVSRKNGQDWMRWRYAMRGDVFETPDAYKDDWKELNSANYGAYTSRNRLFGVFAKPWLPITWPEPTHSKNPTKFSMHGDLKKWMAVKEVLNFKDEGESIFTRKKPLSDKTLERIYAGLIKYIAKGDTAFISKYFSGRPKGKVNSVHDPAPTVTTFGGNSLVQTKSFSDVSIDNPVGAITTVDHHALVQAEFLLKYNSTNGSTGKHIPPSVEDPAPVVSTQERLGLVQPQFLTHYYSNGGGQLSSIEQPAPTIPCKARTAIINPEFLTIYNGKSLHRSVEEPAPVIATNDRLSLIQPEFLLNYNHSSKTADVNDPSPTLLTNDRLALVQPETVKSSQNQSVEDPAGTIMPFDKHRLVQIDSFIVNPSHGGHATSIEAPCPVIVARQDKAPLYLVQVENGPVAIAVFEDDTEPMIRIKQFMAAYNLIDIKMRMLRVHELLSIQGFPEGYKLEGNQADQKKFIGNSVVPQVVKSWTEAMALKLIENRKTKVA